MIALSAHLISIRAATMALGPERLAAALARAYREVAEMAVATASRILPADPKGLTLIWGEGYDVPADADQTLASVWALRARLEGLREQFLADHGLALHPRFGVAMTNMNAVNRTPPEAGSGTSGPGHVIEGPESVIDRAHLLQQACQFYGASVLLDDTSARIGAAGMQIREVDRLGEDGEALLLSHEALSATMLDFRDVQAYQNECSAVHELLGPRGEVPVDRMGAVMAMQGALELYRQGEWKKAAAVLALLASDLNSNPLASIYLDRCKARENPLAAPGFVAPSLDLRVRPTGDGQAPLPPSRAA